MSDIVSIAGMGVTIVLAIIGATAWLSTSLAKLTQSMEGMRRDLKKIEARVEVHDKRIHNLELGHE